MGFHAAIVVGSADGAVFEFVGGRRGRGGGGWRRRIRGWYVVGGEGGGRVVGRAIESQ